MSDVRPSVSRRRLVVAVVALALIGIALGALFASPRGSHDTSPIAGPSSIHEHPAAETPGPVETPPGPVESAVPPVPLDPDAGGPGAVGSSDETSLESAAGSGTADDRDPAQLPPPRAPIAPDQALGVGPAPLGGCLEAYGDDGQCLPAVPPSLAEHVQQMLDAGIDPSTMPHEWTCTELRRYFADGIRVRVAGVDPHRLDRTGDQLACGPDD